MASNPSPTDSTDSSSTDSTPTDPSTPPGPSLLAERPLLAIFVHFVAIMPFWGVVIPGLLYRFSSREFTRANARHAFNWQVLVTGLWVVALTGLFGVSALTDRVALPGLLETLLALPVFAAVLALFVLSGLSFLFPLIAMGKAIFGSAWEYPIAPDFVRLVATHTRAGSD